MRANSSDLEPDSPQCFWADNVEGLAVLISECQIGEPHSFRSGNFAKALARGRYDPHASHPSGIKIPQDVHLHSIGSAGSFFAREINEEPPIFYRAVRLDVVSKNLPLIW